MAAQLERINPLLATSGEVAVQVSYGAVEFGAVGELPDAVRQADAVMYARRRERALRAMPADRPSVTVPGVLSTFGDA